MVAAEIKPFVGKLCQVKYGTKVTVTGTVLGTDNNRLQVKEIGEYSIPLEQVTNVIPLT